MTVTDPLGGVKGGSRYDSRSSLAKYAYVSIYLVASTLSFSKQFFYARLLGPDGYGEFAAFVVFSNAFLIMGDAGFSWLAQKLLPSDLFLGKTAEANVKLNASVLALAMGMSLVAVVGGGVAAVRNDVSVGQVVAVLGLAATQYLFLLHGTRLRSALATTKFAISMLNRSVAVTALGLLAAYVMRSAAAVVTAEIIAGAAIVLMLAIRQQWIFELLRPEGFRFACEWIRRKWRAATTIVMLNGSTMALLSVDRWIGLALMPKAEFGVYALGVVILTTGDLAQSVVYQYVFPSFARTITANGGRDALRMCYRVSAGILGLGVVVGGAVLMSADMALSRWLPQYDAAAQIIKILTVAAVVRTANHFGGIALLLDQERALMALNLAIAVCCACAAVVWHFRIQRLTAVPLAYLATAASVGMFLAAWLIAQRAVSAKDGSPTWGR